MNYRHIYHAGNFADVLKHAALCWIVSYLQRKPAPLRVVETHAGAGRYDLSSPKAARTGEWLEGIARLAEPLEAGAEAFLEPYRKTLAACGWTGMARGMAYPGSPLLARRMLRPADRYVGAELHGETCTALRASLGRDERCKTLFLDGWVALRANIPPRERRGLVLIDPAFEEADEWVSAARAIAAAWRKWPTGCFMLWYPLKNPRLADDLVDDLRRGGLREMLRVELMVDDLAAADRLAGCGLVIVNAPWTFVPAVEAALPALAARLARGGAAGYRCDVVA